MPIVIYDIKINTSLLINRFKRESECNIKLKCKFYFYRKKWNNWKGKIIWDKKKRWKKYKCQVVLLFGAYDSADSYFGWYHPRLHRCNIRQRSFWESRRRQPSLDIDCRDVGRLILLAYNMIFCTLKVIHVETIDSHVKGRAYLVAIIAILFSIISLISAAQFSPFYCQAFEVSFNFYFDWKNVDLLVFIEYYLLNIFVS